VVASPLVAAVVVAGDGVVCGEDDAGAAVGDALGTDGVTGGEGATTVRVNAWVAVGSAAGPLWVGRELVAINVMWYCPWVPAAGVPSRVPVPFAPGAKVTPEGSVPDSDTVGVGEPVAVTVKLPLVPTVKVVASALVNAGPVRYENWSAGEVADVPPGVVTVTSTVPLPAGDVAVISVAETTVTFVAPVVPKSTVVAPIRLVPVMVTGVPPTAGPEAGVTDVTVGTGAGGAGLV